jgi:hypothetical protein
MKRFLALFSSITFILMAKLQAAHADCRGFDHPAVVISHEWLGATAGGWDKGFYNLMQDKYDAMLDNDVDELVAKIESLVEQGEPAVLISKHGGSRNLSKALDKAYDNLCGGRERPEYCRNFGGNFYHIVLSDPHGYHTQIKLAGQTTLPASYDKYQQARKVADAMKELCSQDGSAIANSFSSQSTTEIRASFSAKTQCRGSCSSRQVPQSTDADLLAQRDLVRTTSERIDCARSELQCHTARLAQMESDAEVKRQQEEAAQRQELLAQRHNIDSRLEEIDSAHAVTRTTETSVTSTLEQNCFSSWEKATEFKQAHAGEKFKVFIDPVTNKTCIKINGDVHFEGTITVDGPAPATTEPAKEAAPKGEASAAPAKRKSVELAREGVFKQKLLVFSQCETQLQSSALAEYRAIVEAAKDEFAAGENVDETLSQLDEFCTVALMASAGVTQEHVSMSQNTTGSLVARAEAGARSLGLAPSIEAPFVGPADVHVGPAFPSAPQARNPVQKCEVSLGGCEALQEIFGADKVVLGGEQPAPQAAKPAQAIQPLNPEQAPAEFNPLFMSDSNWDM